MKTSLASGLSTENKVICPHTLSYIDWHFKLHMIKPYKYFYLVKRSHIKSLYLNLTF